jgi:hypothetical protein
VIWQRAMEQAESKRKIETTAGVEARSLHINQLLRRAMVAAERKKSSEGICAVSGASQTLAKGWRLSSCPAFIKTGIQIVAGRVVSS